MRLLKKLTMPCFLAILFVLGISLVSLKANAAPSETEKDGKFFAGYYQDSALTVPSSTETANVKWVRNGVLSLKMQARLKDEKIDIRLLSTVDTLNYSQVGFRIAYDQNGNGTFESTEVTSWNTNSVTQEISANNSTFIYRYDPKVIDTDSCYFITAILSGIPAANWDKAFLIEPFWITMDGTTVYGQSRWFTVNDIQAGATNLNISAKMDASAFDTATVSGIEGATVRNSYYDGKYGHFNLTVADRTALASITPVTVGGTTVYYRNLQNTAAKDTSWYTVPNSLGETKFVVATAADMYGIRDYDTAFANKTIYLVTDIDLNDVSKVNWATGEAASGYTPTQWRAIGRVNYAFTGTFDGQGHTINGLYLTDTSGAGNNFLGLFGRVYGGSVRNVSLKNSYIQSASETVGAIVGQIENGGSFTNLYSNATVKGSRAFIGGLFGKSNSGRVYMSRCWFDGSVISTSSGNSRGFVGGIVAYCPAGTLVLDNCLNSGRIDVSAMSQTNSSYGTGGILGVRTGTIYMVDCAVVGTVTKGASSGFTGTYVGDRDAGMMLGFDNYRVNNGWD
ncbi:MAG: hypothetical protein IK088_00060, partial [Lachnospiraceae bacterium]|nr:hypothetical protein [Lachnospiraceae bacterium]